jgi:hypothetical protein
MSETNPKTRQENAASAGRPVSPPSAGILGWLLACEGKYTGTFLFGDCLTDPEKGRRVRLISRFGLRSFLSGMIFATFTVRLLAWPGGLPGVVPSPPPEKQLMPRRLEFL